MNELELQRVQRIEASILYIQKVALDVLDPPELNTRTTGIFVLSIHYGGLMSRARFLLYAALSTTAMLALSGCGNGNKPDPVGGVNKAAAVDSNNPTENPAAIADSEDCAEGNVCLYRDADFSGPVLVGATEEDIDDGEIGFGCQNFGNLEYFDSTVVNDNVSSIANNSRLNLVFYVDADCEGESATIDSGIFNSKLSATMFANLAYSLDENISSFRVLPEAL